MGKEEGAMRNIKLVIEYDGTDYAGFQKQKEQKTIQGVLEDCLLQILKEKIKIISAGRTDTGVHALNQIVNFKTRSQIPLEGLKRGLNGILPQDIIVKEVKEVKDCFHSRYSALSRKYQYFIYNREESSSIFYRYFYRVREKLNIVWMQQAAEYLVGIHDFSSFCAGRPPKRNPYRTIISLECLHEESQNYNEIFKDSFIGAILSTLAKGSFITIKIHADSFLHSMVRIIVGTLIEVGTGRRKPVEIQKILMAKDRRKAGFTAPPQGLFLTEVIYPQGVENDQ